MSTRKRMIAGLAAGALMAAIVPALGALGSLTGNIGRLSVNLGPLSANLGLHDGSVQYQTGNVGGLSGNLNLWAQAGFIRGAASYLVEQPPGGGFRVLYVQGNDYTYASGSEGARRVSYAWGTGASFYAFYYECNVLQHGCVFANFIGSGDDFTMDPALQSARFDGTLINTQTGAHCDADVVWQARSRPQAGYFHYGSGDVYSIYEAAAADVYRTGNTTATSDCFQPFTNTYYSYLYMDIYGYGFATQSLVPRE